MPRRPPLGQHFLNDARIIDEIVALIRPAAGETLVEIGPGRGALTLPLLAAGAHVVAIELDGQLAERLRRLTPADGALTVHRGSALELDLQALRLGRPVCVAGNLPYQISTPLLFHLSAQRTEITHMVFMLQQEVVERMCADCGGRDYGRLSVALQIDFVIERHFDVPPQAFDPPPRVTSSVVSLRPRGDAPAVDRASLDAVLRAAFAQRRKTLRNALGRHLSERHWHAAGIDPGQRAEQIPVAGFVRLANLLAAD